MSEQRENEMAMERKKEARISFVLSSLITSLHYLIVRKLCVLFFFSVKIMLPFYSIIF